MRIALLLSILVLGGCAGNQQLSQTEQGRPYCHVEETHIDNNGTMDVTTVMECTDKPVNNWQMHLGISDNCREYWYDIRINNRMEPHRGFVCQKLDGSWEIVPDRF